MLSATVGPGSHVAVAAPPLVPRPPQFVLLSYDNAGNYPIVNRLRGMADRTNARLTFFLSGVFLLDVAHRTIYRPPDRSPGSSAIGFQGSYEGRTTQDSVAQLVRSLQAAQMEGHEVGSHLVGHFCGATGIGGWARAQFAAELAQWASLTGDVDRNMGLASGGVLRAAAWWPNAVPRRQPRPVPACLRGRRPALRCEWRSPAEPVARAALRCVAFRRSGGDALRWRHPAAGRRLQLHGALRRHRRPRPCRADLPHAESRVRPGLRRQPGAAGAGRPHDGADGRGVLRSRGAPALRGLHAPTCAVPPTPRPSPGSTSTPTSCPRCRPERSPRWRRRCRARTWPPDLSLGSRRPWPDGQRRWST